MMGLKNGVAESLREDLMDTEDSDRDGLRVSGHDVLRSSSWR